MFCGPAMPAHFWFPSKSLETQSARIGDKSGTILSDHKQEYGHDHPSLAFLQQTSYRSPHCEASDTSPHWNCCLFWCLFWGILTLFACRKVASFCLEDLVWHPMPTQLDLCILFCVLSEGYYLHGVSHIFQLPRFHGTGSNQQAWQHRTDGCTCNITLYTKLI